MQQIQLIGIERAQNGIDIGFDFIAGILLGDYVAFPCAAAVALFQIHRPPRNVEVVHAGDSFLGIDSRSEFLRRAEKHPDFPFVHGVEHRLPHLVARGFLYEADLLRRNTVVFDQFAFDLRIYVPNAGFIGREIAKDHLRAFLIFVSPVVFCDVGGTAAGLVARRIRIRGTYQPHVERELVGVHRHQQHQGFDLPVAQVGASDMFGISRLGEEHQFVQKRLLIVGHRYLA